MNEYETIAKLSKLFKPFKSRFMLGHFINFVKRGRNDDNL